MPFISLFNIHSGPVIISFSEKENEAHRMKVFIFSYYGIIEIFLKKIFTSLRIHYGMQLGFQLILFFHIKLILQLLFTESFYHLF